MIVYGYIGKDVMNTTERLIVLLRSIINSDIAFNCDDISMDDFFYYARQHKVENLCYGAIKKSAITIGEDWISKWEDVCEENTAQLMFQEAEKERLVEAFNDAKIDFLPLKGWYLRDIYPKQEYRFMSDLDILVHRSDREAVNVLLKELGYSGAAVDAVGNGLVSEIIKNKDCVLAGVDGVFAVKVGDCPTVPSFHLNAYSDEGFTGLGICYNTCNCLCKKGCCRSEKECGKGCDFADSLFHCFSSCGYGTQI